MWKLLLDNLWLKLGAVLLACLLWFHASTDKSYEYTLSYSLELVNLSLELILAEPLPTEVKVKISGKGKDFLRLLLTQERSLKIDAQGFSWGQLRFPLKKEMIDISERLELSVIEVVSPKVLKINLQKIKEKKVPIISQLSFFPEDGYFMKGEVGFIPDKVRVKGPSEGVGKTKFVQTQNKEYEGLTKSFSESIDLIMPSFFNLQIFPQRVDFTVDIRKGVKTKLEKLPLKVINLPWGLKGHLYPQTIDLELLGEEKSINELTPESLKVFIDGKGLKKGKIKIAPSIQLPQYILLLKSEPDSFNLEIK